jgi:hypothetical protein
MRFTWDCTAEAIERAMSSDSPARDRRPPARQARTPQPATADYDQNYRWSRYFVVEGA